jgi:RNA polymerase sigma-70 factor, ECF subfamily
MRVEMSTVSEDSAGRRLLAALADEAPAFRPRTYELQGGKFRRLLIALADASPAFNGRGVVDAYTERSRYTTKLARGAAATLPEESPVELSRQDVRPGSKSLGNQPDVEFVDWYMRNAGRLLISLAGLPGVSVEDASDAAQEAMIAVYRHWGEIRGDPASYVWALARRFIFTHSRLAKRSDSAIYAGEKSFIDSSIAEVEARILGEQLLRRLPSRQREAFALYVAGYRQEEIARLMGIQRGTVAALIARARKTLAETLAQGSEIP